jgi:hypothetical protein
VKAQFKYVFLTGFHTRGVAFIVVFAVNFVFIALGLTGFLPLPAHITAVSLSGVAIAVMFVFNVVSDIAIVRRIFAPPGAYLCALTPVPRWKTLLSSVVAITVMDIVTMTAAITGVTWLSLNLAGHGVIITISEAVSSNISELLFGLWFAVFALAGYLLLLMVILFCITMRKSVFYQKPAGGLLAVLTGFGIFYAVSLSSLLLVPFGTVTTWFGIYISITIGKAGLIAYTLLTLIQAAALFILTAKLMERKMNI